MQALWRCRTTACRTTLQLECHRARDHSPLPTVDPATIGKRRNLTAPRRFRSVPRERRLKLPRLDRTPIASALEFALFPRRTLREVRESCAERNTITTEESMLLAWPHMR